MLKLESSNAEYVIEDFPGKKLGEVANIEARNLSFYKYNKKFGEVIGDLSEYMDLPEKMLKGHENYDLVAHNYHRGRVSFGSNFCHFFYFENVPSEMHVDIILVSRSYTGSMDSHDLVNTTEFERFTDKYGHLHIYVVGTGLSQGDQRAVDYFKYVRSLY